jgi:hypothetical protein
MSKRVQRTRNLLGIASGLLLAVTGSNTVQAYSTYSGGCNNCHGDFLGNTSTKGTVFPSDSNHEMHRSSGSMGSACNLCHIGSSRTPVYIWKSNGTASNTGLGCSGCHAAAGLRAHHANNGITECVGCHPGPEVPDPENVSPPYYGTVDTKVRNPGNTVLASNTNENWSVGDYLGLDNDGNNLYDLADYAIGPYRILSTTREGNNVRVTWQTAGGRTNRVQAASQAPGTYTNVGPNFALPGVGILTTNYLDVGGATNRMRFYRVHSLVP